MRRKALCIASVFALFGVIGCSDSSSSRSGSSATDPDVTPPDDFDSPGDGGFVEEVERDGTAGGEPFEGRRLFMEGNTQGASGLWAAGDSQILDDEALPEREAITISWIDDEKLSPYGVLYRTAEDFRFAFTGDQMPDPSTRTIASDVNAEDSCLGPIAFDAEDPDKTAVTYTLLRDEDGICVLPEDSEAQQWSWFLIGADDETPTEFENGRIPRVGLPAAGDNAPSWLVRDGGGDGELTRVFSDGEDTQSVEDDEGETVSLSALTFVAELGPESILVAKEKPDDEGNPVIRLAHFDADANTLTPLVDSIPRAPEPDWVTVRDGTAYLALQNLLVSADAEEVSLIDFVPPEFEGNTVLAEPLFVNATDTHTLWGVRVQTEDSTFRQVRLVEHGNVDGGIALASAGYVDAQVRGHGEGWLYFTVAEGVRSNGQLDSPLAVGVDPVAETIFILEDAHWIGSTLNREETESFSTPDTAPINGLFFRAGSSLSRIAALIDPTDPLVTETNEDGEEQTTLPVATIGNHDLDSAFTAVSMGAGYGPDRLLTAIRVDDADLEDGGSVDPGTDPDITSQVWLADPREDNNTLTDKSNEGPLVRALQLF